MNKSDKRKACIKVTEIMISAQDMMDQADCRRDRKIAEAIFWCAMALEFLIKAPPEELIAGERAVGDAGPYGGSEEGRGGLGLARPTKTGGSRSQ